MKIKEFWNKIFVEVVPPSINSTTPHVILNEPTENNDNLYHKHYYAHIKDYIKDYFGIEIIDNSTVYNEYINTLMIYTEQELHSNLLSKLPKNTIISSVEILDENENPMVVTRIQITTKE